MSIFPMEQTHTDKIDEYLNLPAIATQHVLENVFFKNNTTRRIRFEYENTEFLIKMMNQHNLNREFAMMFLVQIYLHKQTLPSTLIGCLLPYAQGNLALCAEWIERCVDADLADYDHNTKKISFKWTIHAEVQEEIDKYQYHLPMIVQPENVRYNTDTGYLTLPKAFIVTNRKPDDKDYNLDVINIFNRIPLVINYDVATSIENKWKNCFRKPGESISDYKLKMKALARYNRHASDILDHYTDNDFQVFMTHFYDKRGRIYSKGYYIHTQGNSWNKASLEFQPTKIGKGCSGDRLEPLQYLQADIASNFGIKGTWEDRIQWLADNEDTLESLVTHEDCSDPAMFYASVKSYRQVQQGKPTGYPVSLDASASGIQVMSIMFGCAKSAARCNVIPTGQCEDIYTYLYTDLKNNIVYETRENLTRKEFKTTTMIACYGSTDGPKDTFKGNEKHITDFYTCVEDNIPGAWNIKTFIETLWDPQKTSYDWVMPDNFHVSMPVMKKVDYSLECFGSEQIVRVEKNRPLEHSRSLGPNIIHSIDSLIVREMAIRCSSKETTYDITRNTKDGVSYHNDKHVDLVKSLWNHYEQSGFLSSRILMYLDEHSIKFVDMLKIKELRDSIPKVKFPFMAIHDDFRTHPNNAAELSRQYNQILYELAKSDLLAYIVNQFHHTKVKMVKGDLVPDDILSAEYAIN